MKGISQKSIDLWIERFQQIEEMIRQIEESPADKITKCFHSFANPPRANFWRYQVENIIQLLDRDPTNLSGEDLRTHYVRSLRRRRELIFKDKMRAEFNDTLPLQCRSSDHVVWYPVELLMYAQDMLYILLLDRESDQVHTMHWKVTPEYTGWHEQGQYTSNKTIVEGCRGWMQMPHFGLLSS